MLRLFFYTLLVAELFSSCTKKEHNVHFHGRITLNCNNQMPISNQEVEIYRVYYYAKSNLVGITRTDANGYYSLISDVDQPGEFVQYVMNTDVSPKHISPERHFSGQTIYQSEFNDVEMNCQVECGKAIGFHIKNISPFNEADNFNFLILDFVLGESRKDTTISNLTGINVDTVIYRFLNVYCNTYRFTFTKNGNSTISSHDTFPLPNCLDTSLVEILY